ncbi:hypothetical protein MTO96_011398 [Rhipicephalus appendiculatus]
MASMPRRPRPNTTMAVVRIRERPLGRRGRVSCCKLRRNDPPFPRSSGSAAAQPTPGRSRSQSTTTICRAKGGGGYAAAAC